MKQDIKVIIGVIVGSFALLFIGYFMLNMSKSKTPTVIADETVLLRNNKHSTATGSAQLTIVEFADFECPACQAIHPAVKKLIAEYPQQINFVYRHFPLPQHKSAFLAAKASEAAGAQNKFWEMYDALYENQKTWADSKNPTALFLEYATKLNLNAEEFSTALAGKAYEQTINDDLTDARILGVNSTPTFYINGQKYTGPLSYSGLKNQIEAELNK